MKLSAPRSGGRDLITTERELNAKNDEKDILSNRISSLNKELSALNESINSANIAASRADNVLKTKERDFAQEQESITKRNELNEFIADCKEKEDKVS